MFKKMYQKHGNKRRNIAIFGLAAMVILLALSTAYNSPYEIHVMENNFNNEVKTAMAKTIRDNSVPDVDTEEIHLSSASRLQLAFMTNLQNELKNLPQVSYKMQSFKVFGEGDKGSSPPPGFTKPVPGTSIYITLTMNYDHWKLPFHAVFIPKTYDRSIGTLNQAVKDQLKKLYGGDF